MWVGVDVVESKFNSLFDIFIFNNTVGCEKKFFYYSWLSDRPEIDALTVSTSAIIIGGISTIAVPHLTAYWMYIVYCILFAFGVG
jgi:hypothetical protein